MAINQALHEQLVTLLTSMGLELWGCEFVPRGRKVQLCLYIDKKGGVTVDDCATVGRHVRALFAVEDAQLAEAYLEVSSPGIDRPLFDRAHYESVVGQRIKIKLHVLKDSKRNLQGMLSRVEGDKFYLISDETQLEVIVDFQDIAKANLIGDVKI